MELLGQMLGHWICRKPKWCDAGEVEQVGAFEDVLRADEGVSAGEVEVEVCDGRPVQAAAWRNARWIRGMTVRQWR